MLTLTCDFLFSLLSLHLHISSSDSALGENVSIFCGFHLAVSNRSASGPSWCYIRSLSAPGSPVLPSSFSKSVALFRPFIRRAFAEGAPRFLFPVGHSFSLQGEFPFPSRFSPDICATPPWSPVAPASRSAWGRLRVCASICLC